MIAAIQSLAKNPRPAGCRKLTGSNNDWRIRVGDYRIVYEIADTIRVVRVKSRPKPARSVPLKRHLTRSLPLALSIYDSRFTIHGC